MDFTPWAQFGEVAIERLRHAIATVWLVDSNVQIAALALGSVMYGAWRECLERLTASNVRLFTTERLFEETSTHWWFANKVVNEHGAVSTGVVAAARGEPPFWRSNAFLEGFIRWQAAGNPADWDNYNFEAFGSRNPTKDNIRLSLILTGIEVLEFPDWPGFKDDDFVQRDEYINLISKIRHRRTHSSEESADDVETIEASKKAVPESEALLVVKKECAGRYFMLSDRGATSPAWFISDTSILNFVEHNLRITWQPDAFLRFSSTLSPGTDSLAASRAFDSLLWGLARSGLSLLDDKAAESVLKGIIDQTMISIVEMRELYESTLAEKYSEPMDSVLARVPPLDRPLVAIQLANEISQAQRAQRVRAEANAAEETKRAVAAEKKLQEVEKYRRKMEEKKGRGRRKAKKQLAKSQKKRK